MPCERVAIRTRYSEKFLQAGTYVLPTFKCSIQKLTYLSPFLSSPLLIFHLPTSHFSLSTSHLPSFHLPSSHLPSSHLLYSIFSSSTNSRYSLHWTFPKTLSTRLGEAEAHSSINDFLVDESLHLKWDVNAADLSDNPLQISVIRCRSQPRAADLRIVTADLSRIFAADLSIINSPHPPTGIHSPIIFILLDVD